MKKFSLALVALFPAYLYGQNPSELSDAAAKALPAVVQVQAFLSDSLWNSRPSLYNKRVNPSRTGRAVPEGIASGVLLSADGQVMTNAHVLAGCDSVVVILQDRRSYLAVPTGSDGASDLALLKIAATGLSFLELGDPNLLRIGDPVLAVGNPLELTSTVTAGILSARFRSVEDPIDATMVNSYLQSDAASNEGMSGSALVDRNGKLIGINAAILSPTGYFAGYAFAIPSGLIKKAWQELALYGRVRHAGLDLVFSDMDATQARRLHAKSANGVLIDSLVRHGAGDHAGLRRDDILLQLDKVPLINAAHLREMLAQRSPGDSVMLTIERRGVELSVPAALLPSDEGQVTVKRKNEMHSLPVLRTSRH